MKLDCRGNCSFIDFVVVQPSSGPLPSHTIANGSQFIPTPSGSPPFSPVPVLLQKYSINQLLLFLHAGHLPGISTLSRRLTMRILYAEKYVSPRERPLAPEEQTVRRIAYALKVPTTEALRVGSRALAPLVDSHATAGAAIVLMPVPTSTNILWPNQALSQEIAEELRRKTGGTSTDWKRRSDGLPVRNSTPPRTDASARPDFASLEGCSERLVVCLVAPCSPYSRVIHFG